MKKAAFLAMLLAMNTNIYAHSSVSIHDGDAFDTTSSGGSMLNLPVMIDFDGKITYGIGVMDHSSHSGHDMGDGMDHDGMDHGGMGNSNDGMDHGDMGSSNGDMDHGGMNHDDMHGGDMDNGHDNMNHDMKTEKMSKVMWHVMPMLHLGYDKIERVVALGNQQINNFELVKADSQGEYLAIRNKRIEAGAGLMAMGMPTSIDWGGYFQLGFMPYKGSYYFSKQKVSTYKSAQSSDSLKIPHTIEEVKSLSEGDKIAFSSHGGVMIGTGVGATIFTDFSANYMTQGTWRVEVEKAKNEIIKVRVTEADLKHVMLNAGATILSSNIGRHKVKSISLGYSFDFNSREAREAYESLLQGDLSFAERLLDSSIKGVESLDKKTSEEIGQMSTTKIGLPVLFHRNKMKMRTYSVSKGVDLKTNSKLNTEMTMIHNEVNTEGIWSRHMKNYSMYMGAENSLNSGDSSFTYDTDNFVWFFESDKVSKVKLNKVLRKWNKFIGSEKLEKFYSSEKNLGYARATLNLVLKNKSHSLLKEIAEKEYSISVKKLVKKMLKKKDLFHDVMNKLGKSNYSTTLKIESENYNSTLLTL